MHRRTLLLVLALGACDAGAESRTGDRPLATVGATPALAASSPAADTAPAPRHASAASGASAASAASGASAPGSVAAGRAPASRALPAPRPPSGDSGVRVADPGIVRGLYVNRWASQSPRRMRNLIAIADTTEINALVLDLKDEFGLNYTSRDSLVQRNAGRAGVIPGLPALIDTMKAHGIIPIARLVVFKDSVAARLNPDHTILTPEGTAWRDREGLTWVNPYDPGIREYNIRVAEEMARLGFEEIQFDYIRFPEPYRSLPQQVFPGADGMSKAQALARFLGEACPRVRALGARCTADVFGLVTTVNGTLEVGQHWEVLARVTDVLLPMVYPSHYPPGSFGVPRPNADPYRIVYEAIAGAYERNRKIGIENPEHVRAWLQAFTLGQPPYGAEQIREQKRAVYDAGFDGWILWHPGSLYEQFIPALEREAESRKKGIGDRG
ncbi:MAG TPA: putative glycoside hydrolase [Gemmatimonadaceae bacterium]|nr:putative glycoside hydrolase [Gemmatimonadaceae bacterium]